MQKTAFCCDNEYNNVNDHDFKYIPASQSEIDHVIIQIILKILSNEHHLQIDVELIGECLSFLKNFHKDEFEPYLEVYDPSLPFSKDHQMRIIEDGKKHMNYKKMLEDLNFYTK